ncbi:hypothetical protein [Salinispora pacifica]|uniref:hypothetical protein n=1 Tax=Salinispora pacifica TaxID=351187 RepID=UPI0004820868|nr:hypothetical protein [Salinispora pacifica]
MGATEPYVTVMKSTFVARFLLDPDETEEWVTNVDTVGDLPDGSRWALTILTVDEVRRLLVKWKETGDVRDGSDFWAVDQLIVPAPGGAG